MNDHKWQVFLISLSFTISALTLFILAKLENHKPIFPLFFQTILWCVTGLAVILTCTNCVLLYQGKKNQDQTVNNKKKAVHDFHRYFELQQPPEMNT